MVPGTATAGLDTAFSLFSELIFRMTLLLLLFFSLKTSIPGTSMVVQ